MSLRTPSAPPEHRPRPGDGAGATGAVAAPAAPRAGARDRLAHALRPAAWPPRLLLLAILAGGLVLRLYGNRHGLPFVYHPDEATHFTNRAIHMFADRTLDPGYFQNPSGFTELVYAVLRLQWGHGWPFHYYRDLLDAYARDPSGVFHTARVVSAVMCMAGVGAVYAVGRRLWGVAEGLAAAAVLSFAFLPVAYSRFAVTDVSVLAPVAVAVYGIVRVREDGRLRWYLLAGVAAGLAIGFKYTAGVILVPLVLAGFPRGRRTVRALVPAAASLAAAGIAFLVTTPYFLLDLHEAIAQLKAEQVAASIPKLGQGPRNPFLFYLDSLTWAFGWGPALAALAGLVVLIRGQRARALLLGLMPLLLYLYMSVGAERFFARWLLPIYPVLALFAGVGFAWLARRLVRGAVPRAALLAVLVIAALVQPLVSDLHTGRLLSRTDTRQMLRDYVRANVRQDARVVADPALPRDYFDGWVTLGFGAPPKTRPGDFGTPTRFVNALSPARIEAYRRARYCTVVVMSLVSERAFETGVRPAMAYYRALPREGRAIFHASPYKPGAKPVPFDFDFSTHLYYPSAYQRPGPEVTVYRLNRCAQGYGRDAHAL